MEAEATPSSTPSAAPRRSGPSGWRWGIATLTVVAIILGATFVTHSLAARLRHPPATPAPALPPLAVLAVTAPGTDYELTALDASNGHLVALAADRQPQCPPQGACPVAPPLANFVVLDGSTGQVLAITPVTGEVALYSSAAEYLMVDEGSHRAYAIGPGFAAVFSTETGAFMEGIPLPAPTGHASLAGAAFDGAQAQLYALGRDGLLTRHDFRTDPPNKDAAFAEPAGRYSGLALDILDNVLFTLRPATTGQGTTLLTIDATTLATVAQVTLPANATVGPFDPATGALTLLGADGHTYRATYASGRLSVAADGPANALDLGWNPALAHTYVAHAGDVQVLDASGQPVAALPVRVYAGTMLLTDPARSLLYLTANGGSLIIAQDAATPPARVPNAATAILLARAALPRYLPDTNQDPPFLDTETFWPGVTAPTTFARDFYIHFSDLGWTGPYIGSVSTAVAPLSGRSNAYQVTFTITWQQLYQRTHTWVLDVAADGAVSYVSDTGDVIP